MSNTISLETVMSEFNDMVQEELQSHQKLAGTVREYDTSGQDFNLPYFDQLALSPASFDSGNIPVVGVAQRNVQIVQGNHNLKTTIGNAYQTLFNYDVIQGHVKQHANALGRFNDKMKLDALIAADADFTTGNNNLITPAAMFKVTTLVNAKFKLIDNGVNEDGMSLYSSAKNMQSFFNDEDFKSWDQNEARPLMKGSIGYYMGVDCRILSSASAANTLPGGNTPSNYVVDYESVAVAYNRRPFCTVATENWEDRVSVLSVATAGSAVTRPEGVCKILTKLTA